MFNRFPKVFITIYILAFGLITMGYLLTISQSFNFKEIIFGLTSCAAIVNSWLIFKKKDTSSFTYIMLNILSFVTMLTMFFFMNTFDALKHYNELSPYNQGVAASSVAVICLGWTLFLVCEIIKITSKFWKDEQ